MVKPIILIGSLKEVRMEAPVGIFWTSKPPRSLINGSSEKHLKLDHSPWQMLSGKIMLGILHHVTDLLIYFLIPWYCRFRFLAVRDAESTSRFQIGSIDLYSLILVY